MTASTLLRVMRDRDVRLAVEGLDVVVDAPAGVLTDADWTALAASKPALLALLATAAAPPVPTSMPPEPSSACLLCGTTAWQWVPDWPEPGQGAWCCKTCISHPRPTLAEIYAGLTDAERQRLEAEAAGGDDLARDLVNALAATTRRRA